MLVWRRLCASVPDAKGPDHLQGRGTIAEPKRVCFFSGGNIPKSSFIVGFLVRETTNVSADPQTLEPPTPRPQDGQRVLVSLSPSVPKRQQLELLCQNEHQLS